MRFLVCFFFFTFGCHFLCPVQPLVFQTTHQSGHPCCFRHFSLLQENPRMILFHSAADKWLILGRVGEKESNTDRETIFHFALDLFFIEFLAPLFPSLAAKSFLYCLEDGKTQVGGRRRLIFQRASSMPMT